MVRKLSTSYQKLSAITLVAITLGVAIPLSITYTFYSLFLYQPSLTRFSSYEELETFVSKTSSFPYFKEIDLIPGITSRGSANQESFEYSGTNIQVEGVDEADIVKCDGEHLFLVSSNNVTIIKAYPPEDATVITRITLNETVKGVFVYDNRLVIFSEGSPYNSQERINDSPFGKTFVRVYNIENILSPHLVRTVSFDGNYFDSRMLKNYVYILTYQPAYIHNGKVPLPTVESNGMIEQIEAKDVYYANVTDCSYTLITVASMNVHNDNEAPIHETFLLGFMGQIYVSLENIYIAIPGYSTDSQKTDIHRIRINEGQISHEASGLVPGYILNQFSMDEYDNHFRVATTTGSTARFFQQATSQNNVYILDMNLQITGKLENLAPGERIYSARFLGKRCYLVTFKKVDPLFVIDLEDPFNPKVLGKLKIPGYSDYLHPYDENHLIGIGKNTVEAEEGDFAWYQGVKISLFNIEDVEHPKEVATFSIGDRGTDSPVLREHKALLFDKNRNLLAIPVLVAEIDESKYPNGIPPTAYGDYVWQGLYVFNLTENNILLRGKITHIENEDDLLKSGYYYHSPYSIERSLYIENVLYSLSSKKIKMNNLTNLLEIGEVRIQ
jgi:uncharacterized secreted protein with C-terminal beta-propeller domain